MTILDSIDLFNSLSDNEKETLSLFCQERFVHGGENVFNE